MTAPDDHTTPEPQAEKAAGVFQSQPSLKLMAATAKDAGRGIIRLSMTLLRELGLSAGDTVAVTGSRTTHARALPAVEVANDSCTLDLAQRQSIGASLGDRVTVRPQTLPEAIEVRLGAQAPLAQSAADRLRRTLSDHLADVPVTEGDHLGPPAAPLHSNLTVTGCTPHPAARMTAQTKVVIDTAGPDISSGFDGVGGLGAQIAKVREMVELPLRRPDLFTHLGLTPPRGVLFTGPPGSGKTLLARAVAEQIDATFFQINGPEIVSKHYGDSEQKLREVFQSAS
ncbi:MAG: AAA family ATPase, partial [Pseudomonadota bacterium]